MIEPDKKPVFTYAGNAGYFVGTISTRDQALNLMFWDVYITHDHASWFRVLRHGRTDIRSLPCEPGRFAAWYEADLQTLFATDKERRNDPSISPNAR